MTSQARPYEPLTSQNAALILVDHQVGLMTGVRDYSTGLRRFREVTHPYFQRMVQVGSS